MADSLTANFTKRFPGGAVVHVNLDRLARGAFVTALFGPSGSGKTTVLRCLAGLERPEEGSIRYGAELWFDAAQGICLTPQKRNIGFVFQDFALFPHLTVSDNINHGLRGVSAGERRHRVDEMLHRFELRGLEMRLPHQLSAGQQQRVALARALVCRPRLLLLDEPLSALDAALRETLRGELRRQLATCGIPVFIVTHDRTEALAMADEIAVLVEGKVRQTGPVLGVFNQPADAEVAKTVGVETLQPGIIIYRAEGLVTVQVGTTKLTALAPSDNVEEVFVCIRGEDVILQRTGGSASSVRNHLLARVVAIRPGSPMVRVELDVGFPLFALITRPACEELELRVGDSVVALVKAPAVHLVAH